MTAPQTPARGERATVLVGDWWLELSGPADLLRRPTEEEAQAALARMERVGHVNLATTRDDHAAGRLDTVAALQYLELADPGETWHAWLARHGVRTRFLGAGERRSRMAAAGLPQLVGKPLTARQRQVWDVVRPRLEAAVGHTARQGWLEAEAARAVPGLSDREAGRVTRQLVDRGLVRLVYWGELGWCAQLPDVPACTCGWKAGHDRRCPAHDTYAAVLDAMWVADDREF